MAKPFVKWAGGKSTITSTLEAALPVNFDDIDNVTYIEPFVGGGAMLFHMLQSHRNIRRAIINDINQDLIHCYQLIRDTPDILIGILSELERQFLPLDQNARAAMYYRIRDEYNHNELAPDYRAALFMFLNHTCYNGLYRENSDGLYNVPMGRYNSPVICNRETILEDHELFNNIDLIIRTPGDYKFIARNLSKKGSNFVYFDPPYRPLNVTSCFKEYSCSPFGDEQQKELKLFCDRLTRKHCLIMLSNSNSKNTDGSSFFGRLYEGYNIQIIEAPRAINANGSGRKKQSEVLIRNY